MSSAGQMPQPSEPHRGPQYQAGPHQGPPSAYGSQPAPHHPTAPHQPTVPHQPPVPQPQPLQLAKALLIVFLVRILLFVVTEFGMNAVYWLLRAAGADSALLYGVIALGGSLLALLSGGLWVACLVMGIVVIVTARDQLRTGAIVMLVALVVPTFFSIDLSGDFSSGIGTVVGIVNLVLDLLALIASAVGAFFLWKGYRSAAQEEGSRYAVL